MSQPPHRHELERHYAQTTQRLAIIDVRLVPLEETIQATRNTCARLQMALKMETYAVHCQRYDRLAHCLQVSARWQKAPPAYCARDDRQRRATVTYRPLSETEDEIRRLKGTMLFRVVMGILSFILPWLFARMLRQRARDITTLRRQEHQVYQRILTDLERQAKNAQRELDDERDTVWT